MFTSFWLRLVATVNGSFYRRRYRLYRRPRTHFLYVLHFLYFQNCQEKTSRSERKTAQQTKQRWQSECDDVERVEAAGLRPRSDVDPPRPAPNTFHMRYERSQGKI